MLPLQELRCCHWEQMAFTGHLSPQSLSWFWESPSMSPVPHQESCDLAVLFTSSIHCPGADRVTQPTSMHAASGLMWLRGVLMLSAGWILQVFCSPEGLIGPGAHRSFHRLSSFLSLASCFLVPISPWMLMGVCGDHSHKLTLLTPHLHQVALFIYATLRQNKEIDSSLW